MLLAAASVALWLFHRPSADNAARLVPQEATAYVHLFLRPSTQQRIDIEHLLEVTLGSDDAADDVKDALEAIIEPLLEGSDLAFDRDVRPWLGAELAWFALPDPVEQAVLIDTKDAEAGRDALKQLIEGRADLEVRVFGDFVAIGTPGALAALGDPLAEGHRLAEEDAFSGTLASIPEDRVLTVYLTSDDGPLITALSVRSDGLQVDASRAAGVSLTTVLGSADALLFRLFGSVAELPEAIDGRVEAVLRLSGVIDRPQPDAADLLGDGYEPTVEIHPRRALGLAEALGLLDSQTEVSLPGWARHLDRVVLGEQSVSGSERTRIFIGVK